ncbi:MAG: hypothetical protein JRJ38_15385 [Deltaproteobacteria bacterium]|nr:hypothetical protein [Deltaproteobacteria bacterium]
MNQLIEILVDRLERKGMAQNTIPGFIRSLANTISEMPDMTIGEVRRRLQSLGWDDFELDDHTLQLIIAVFQDESLIDMKHKPASWFESTFNLSITDKTVGVGRTDV